MFKTGE